MKKIFLPTALFVMVCLSILTMGGVPPGGSQALAQEGGSDVSLAGQLPVVINRTYTLNADFDEGVLINVNHTDVPDQIQLNRNLSTFPFIWIALSGRGTIVKVNTETGVILGEYRTAPEGMGLDPSRTTVDLKGNVWVGNRAEDRNGLGSAIQIGLHENTQCIDRNGNGTIDTSTGLGDVKPWPNATGANTNGGVTQAQDECVIHFVRTSGRGTRSLAIDASNNVWIGGNNQFGAGNRRFDLVDGATGAIKQSIGPFACGGYGGLVDSHGVLWSAGESTSQLLRYDPGTSSATCIPIGMHSYGLGIDSQGNIWNSNWTSSKITKLNSAGQILGAYSTGGTNARGVVVTTDDNVWIANSGTNTLTRLSNSGAVIATIPVGSQPTGVAIDAAGKIWVMNYDSSNAMRVDPATNQVDLTVPLGANALPYNYSDMTGIVALTHTSPQGTWTVVYDSGKAGTPWGQVAWNSSEPAGSTVTVKVRSAETNVDLSASTYVPVSNGVAIANVPNGRYLQIETTLTPGTNNTTPILYDLTVQAAAPPCTITNDKTASSHAVVAGSAVTITLSLAAVGDCSALGSPVDAVLVLDRSGSMGGQSLTDAKNAAISFLNQMNLTVDHVAVASFASSGTAQLNSQMTRTLATATSAINGLSAGGSTDIASGLVSAEEEFASVRRQATNAPVIILLSDGYHNETPASSLQDVATRIKNTGVRIITIGLGTQVNEDQLRNIASSDTDYYYAPDSSKLAAIYQTIAPTLRVAGRDMTLVDTLDSNMTLVPNSFQGPITPTVSGNKITWEIAAVPTTPVELSYQVTVPFSPGTWNTNESAIATFIDAAGNPATLVFPVPQVVVPYSCEAPEITDIQVPWVCVGKDTAVVVNGNHFFKANPTFVIGSALFKARIGNQALTVQDYSATSATANLSGTASLTAGVYDVVINNVCTVADIKPSNVYTTTNPQPVPTVTDVFTATLPDAFTVFNAPRILNVRPPEGFNDIPSDITVCGEGFAPGTTAMLKKPGTTTEIAIGSQQYGGTCIAGTVPPGLDPGEYDVIVRGECGEVTSTYRVMSPELNDDLYGQRDTLWLNPSICAHVDEPLSLGMNVYRRGGKDPLQNVQVSFYEGDPQANGTKIGDGNIPLLSPRVGATERITGTSTTIVTWVPSRGEGTYTIYAVIDPANTVPEDIETNNVVSRTVQLLPGGNSTDRVAPRVDLLTINEGSVDTFNSELNLKVNASDVAQPGATTSGVKQIQVVEYRFNGSTLAWVPIKASGWLSYTETISWTLRPEGGVGFLQVWASDAAGNISRYANQKMLNYIRPCTEVQRNGTQVYRRTLKAGDTLQVEVASCDQTGDPDLYIWPATWKAGDPPLVSNQKGTATERLSFVATTDGEYQVEVYGYATTRYSVQIEVQSGPTTAMASWPSISVVDPSKTARTEPAVPLDNRPRVDTMNVNVVVPAATALNRVYLPFVQR